MTSPSQFLGDIEMFGVH